MRTGPIFVHVDADGDELVVVKTGSVDMYAVEILPGGELPKVRVVDVPEPDLRRLYLALRDHFGGEAT